MGLKNCRGLNRSDKDRLIIRVIPRNKVVSATRDEYDQKRQPSHVPKSNTGTLGQVLKVSFHGERFCSHGLTSFLALLDHLFVLFANLVDFLLILFAHLVFFLGNHVLFFQQAVQLLECLL